MSTVNPSRAGLETVLSKIGRASTPPVPRNQLGLSLTRMLSQGSKPDTRTEMIYGLLGSSLRSELVRQNISFGLAIPGDSVERLPRDFSGIVLIDRCEFTDGPWISVESESGIQLREEIYELCRYARNNGIPVWFLDEPREATFSVIRIKSACDVTFPYQSIEDFEEDAPVNIEFSIVNSIINRRFDFEETV